MKIGLLWFDDNAKRTLADKVGLAALRYEQKFGMPPNVCFVHPVSLTDGEQVIIDGILVTTHAGNSILPNDFWLGVIERPHRTENTNVQA